MRNNLVIAFACLTFVLLTSACDSPRVQVCKTRAECHQEDEEFLDYCIEEAEVADEEEAEQRAKSEGADCAELFQILDDYEQCRLANLECVDGLFGPVDQADCEEHVDAYLELLGTTGYDCTIADGFGHIDS